MWRPRLRTSCSRGDISHWMNYFYLGARQRNVASGVVHSSKLPSVGSQMSTSSPAECGHHSSRNGLCGLTRVKRSTVLHQALSWPYLPCGSVISCHFHLPAFAMNSTREHQPKILHSSSYSTRSFGYQTFDGGHAHSKKITGGRAANATHRRTNERRLKKTSGRISRTSNERVQGKFRTTVNNIVEPESVDTLDLSDFQLKEDGTLGLDSFSDFGVTPSLCKALEGDGITSPTSVQSLSLPITMTSKHHCMIKSETGSGKTLVFLLPALQDKLPGLTTLIVVPTRELAVQMFYQCTKLNNSLKDNRKKRVMTFYTGVHSDEKLTAMYNELKPHILIATPKQLVKLLETNAQDFVNLRRLVLDEVDKLLLVPQKKASKKKKIIREVHPRPTTLLLTSILGLRRRFKMQLIATSATLDANIQEDLVEMGWGEHPRIITVSEKMAAGRFLDSPSLIEHCYLECDDTSFGKNEGQYDKIDVLSDHFRSSKEKSALVFIHRGAPIMQFLYQLRKRGLIAEALHENIQDPNLYQKFLEAFKNGKIELVIATEETVRGLDFPWLDSVYLFEVPRTANEYLHLCGRVGRVKRRGRSIVIVESVLEKRRLGMHYNKLRVSGNCISPF